MKFCLQTVLTLFLSANILFVGISQNGKQAITLEKVVKEYKFYPKGIKKLKSMADGKHFTRIEANGRIISKYSYHSGQKVATIIDMDKVNHPDFNRFEDYEFSDDEKLILLYNDRERIYRRSFLANYFVYDIENGQLNPVTKGKVQLATFSPDGRKIAFVRKNNLYIKELETKEEYAITTDGKFNYIINGVPDWVYEEEFGFNKAFTWSPDSKSLAFMRFDESLVKEFGMTMFSGTYPALEDNLLYPELRVWKYPKAGEDNSIVSIHIYDVEKGESITVDIGKEKDQYIPRIKWTPYENQLCIYRLNRLQNKLELLLANRDSGQSRVIYTDENKYYIAERILDDIFFFQEQEQIIVPSEKDGYYHIYLYDLAGNELKQLTKGKWDVTDFYGVDELSEKCFFQAAKETPLRREIYSIKTDGRKLNRLSKKVGTNSAKFSKGFKKFINTHSSSSSPNLITLHENDGSMIRVLEDNLQYREKIKKYAFNHKEFFRFENKDGNVLNGYMIKPPDFDENEKYPVIMIQYSGPGSQTVKDSWGIDWLYALSQNGYLIVSVDGRGTGARGEEFRKMTYLQLGKYETIDQVEAANYLQSLDFVDPDRIGIYGWSYGGFISSMCMVKGQGTFKAGIAVAPVTDYRYYDNIYTERFMRTPKENPDGYFDNAPLNFAEDFQGKLLLIHGLADDNVHVQNTLEFAERLVQANKQFEMQLYTNRNHSIYGGNTRFHLYTRIMEFIEKSLKIEDQILFN